MKNFKENLKAALCSNDIHFLKKHKSEYNIDERFEDENNDTLLLYSISYNESNIYQYLLNNGANYHLKNDENENIIHALIYSNNIERLTEFVDKYDVDLNAQSVDGASPLLLAISLERFELAEFLIKHGVDINIADDEGITPLHLLAQGENYELVDLLISKQVNPNLKTSKGNLALALAVNTENIIMIKKIYNYMYNGSASQSGPNRK